MNNRESGFSNSVVLALLLVAAAVGAVWLALSDQSVNPTVSSVSPSSQLAQVSAPTNGLVGYWNLDEGSGSMANDTSGSGFNGSLVSSPSWTAGVIGGGLSFNGTSQYVDIPNKVYSLSAGTVSLWVKNVGGGTIIGSYGGSNTSRSPTISISSSGALSWEFSNLVTQSTGANVPSGQWTNITLAYSGGAVTVYLNCSAIASRSATALSSLYSHVFIGKYGNYGSSYFNGAVDDVRIYNRALSLSEVQSIYQAGTGISCTPTNPPVISDISAGTPSQSSVIIAWTTDQAASSQVLYGVTSSYGSQTAADQTLTTSHSATLSNLSTSTVYHYSVKSTDSSGQSSQSSDRTFTTAAPLTATISASPNPLLLTTGSGSPTITWSSTGPVSSCTASGGWSGTLAVSGSQTASPISLPTTYSIMCSDSSGNSSPTASVYENVMLSTGPSTSTPHIALFASAGAGGIISPSGTVSVSPGGSQTFTITPNTGYQVSGVTVDNASVGAVTSYAFTNINRSHTISASFSPVQVSGGPILYWKLDDGSGSTALDSSGNGYAGTVVNGVWTAGKVGGALSFNGTNSTVSASSVNNTGQAASVAFWLNESSYSTGGIILESSSNLNNSSTGFGMFQSDTYSCPSNSIDLVIRGNRGYNVKCFSVPSAGWHHFAAIYDKSQAAANEVSLYIDGVLQSRISQPYSNNNTNSFSANPFYLMSRSGTMGFLAGTMDDVRVYNRAISAAEAVSLYAIGGNGNNTPPTTPTNLSATAVSSSQINLSWTASTDNVGVTGYNIYRGGVNIGTSPTNSYSDTGLSASTLYGYAVQAYDAAGLTSSQSASASATTQTGTTYTLSVTKSGTGSGTVTGGAGSINCGATCSQSGIPSGASTVLSETPASGSVFAGWGGACSGASSTCTVTVNGNTAVSAVFNASAVTPPSAPANLTATASSSSQISLSWTASAAGTNAVAGYNIYMDGSATKTTGVTGTSYLSTGLAAQSTHSYQVKAYDIAGNESSASMASATTWPAPSMAFSINQQVATNAVDNVRSTAAGTMLGTQAAGTVGTVVGGPVYANLSGTNYWWWNVSFSASPSGWVTEGGLNAYTAPSTYTLSVTKSGTGSGTVTGGAGSINCGATCSQNGIPSGASTVLSETPASGSVFAGWGGACSGASSTCTVTVNGNTVVSAVFNASGTISGGCSGTCYYVTPNGSGSKNGSDWNNAYAGFGTGAGQAHPASLVRGAAYYVSSGTYPGVIFSSPNSGTSMISVLGATAANAGSVAGWTNSLSVSNSDGGSQAIWNGPVTFYTSYWTFDGSAPTGKLWDQTPADYGFKFVDGLCYAITLGDNKSDTQSNFNIGHVYAKAYYGDPSSSPCSLHEVFFLWNNVTGSGQMNNMTLSDSLINGWQGGVVMDSGGQLIQNWVVQRNVFENAVYYSHAHSEQINGNNSYPTNTTIRYNLFQNNQGTCTICISLENNSTDTYVYGNVFSHENDGNGVIGIGSSGLTTTNLQVYNNSFDSTGAPMMGMIASGYTFANSAAYNNLLYNSNASLPSGVTGSNNTVVSSNPFVNDAVGVGNFELKSNIGPGKPLPAPYNIDPTGAVRATWTLGAFEY